MFGFLRLWACVLIRLFRSRRVLVIENLALRQQLAVFKRQHSRPRLAAVDKFFWVFLRRFWCSWKQALIVVSPDSVVRWHRAGFRPFQSAVEERPQHPVNQENVKHRIHHERDRVIWDVAPGTMEVARRKTCHDGGSQDAGKSYKPQFVNESSVAGRNGDCFHYPVIRGTANGGHKQSNRDCSHSQLASSHMKPPQT
jgi:hypothetical protein